MNRRATFLGLGAIVVAALAGDAARAHHGSHRAEDTITRLTGVIRSVRLGNPHGMLFVDVNGTLWTVEVSEPWRDARAGLEDGLLAKGATVTVSGHRSADPAERRIEAVAVTIKGRTFDLHPDLD